jgi:hypothetical protein
MRTRTLLLVSALLAATATARADTGRSAPELDRARTLDHEGARAFREGRYTDAMRYFEDALKLGAPSEELWNIARCLLKLDQPEDASDALERYLRAPDVSASDRAEAKDQLEELRHRRSTLTVTSSPANAEVDVDGRPAGRTPLSTDLAPGEHTVVVREGARAVHEERVVARFGRAVIVDTQLGPGGSGKRFEGTAVIGVLWARLGSFGGSAHPAALLGAAYVPYDHGRFVVALGARATLTDDTWGNSVGASASPPSAVRCVIPGHEEATALSAFLDGAVGYRASRRLRIEGDVGVGVAGYFASRVGGDLFDPTCSAAPGIVPALHAGGSVSYAFGPVVRAVVSPIWLELQPAFDGARSAPVDASGAWLRLGAGIGVAVDL